VKCLVVTAMVPTICVLQSPTFAAQWNINLKLHPLNRGNEMAVSPAGSHVCRLPHMVDSFLASITCLPAASHICLLTHVFHMLAEALPASSQVRLLTHMFDRPRSRARPHPHVPAYTRSPASSQICQFPCSFAHFLTRSVPSSNAHLTPLTRPPSRLDPSHMFARFLTCTPAYSHVHQLPHTLGFFLTCLLDPSHMSARFLTHSLTGLPSSSHADLTPPSCLDPCHMFAGLLTCTLAYSHIHQLTHTFTSILTRSLASSHVRLLPFSTTPPSRVR
jgi:hypothetical protein